MNVHLTWQKCLTFALLLVFISSIFISQVQAQSDDELPSVQLTEEQYVAYEEAFRTMDLFTDEDQAERQKIIDMVVADAVDNVGLDANNVELIMSYVEAQLDFAPQGVVDDASLLGKLQCEDYYSFGSVSAKIGTDTGEVLAGTPVTFSGIVTNDNPYPIVDGALYVKVFRYDEPEETLGLNGPSVVDQGFVLEDIGIAAGESVPVSFTWEVPAYAISGDYSLATFFTTSHKFNFSGLSFTDDVVGTDVHFTVFGEVESKVAFDKSAVTLNEELHAFANFPLRFTAEEPVAIAAPLVNTTAEDQEIDLEWKVYFWDAQLHEQQVEYSKETMMVPANGSIDAMHTVTDTTYPVYLVEVVASYKDTKSVLNIRFVREGVDRARLNFPSIMSYPLVAGEENTIFSCYHGISDSVIDGAELILSLVDSAGNTLFEKSYTGAVTSDMYAAADVFVSNTDETEFDLTATLSQNGTIVDTVTVPYRCGDIDQDLCIQAEEEVVADETVPLIGYLIYVFAAMIVLVFAGAGYLVFVNSRGRKEVSSDTEEWTKPE